MFLVTLLLLQTVLLAGAGWYYYQQRRSLITLTDKQRTTQAELTLLEASNRADRAVAVSEGPGAATVAADR